MNNRRITSHAIQRYIERVDHSANPTVAFHRLVDLAGHGRVRPNPRAWTSADPAAGKVFIYPAADPDVCLVATRDTVVTVLTRGLCRHDRGPDEPRRLSHRRHATLEVAPAWDRHQLEDAA